ncbi:carbohydrate-binding protein [Neorhizobium alkalisoli]|uniref:Alpha-L-rhamnosidase-like protein n=1 Tax=Neorhizobium alkalisoli TaxID=528178 RepID=A0A561QPU0_9HYPH|nr:carbohydrate-binding protein [Neorhizobium alkalisoli]TWF52403.1 hypothetical protein FHW37_105507 [Neorhizobium alkalisoli]
MPGFGKDDRRSHLFADPPAEFRPAAYWFWHTLPADDEIETQLRDFRNQGYGTILIQARLAMPRELYLSEAFLERYRKAVEVMQKLGLVAGLYDDYNWTSGQAGGRTVSGAPHLSERHLFWATTSSSGGEISGIEAPFATGMGPDIASWIYDGGRPVFGEWELLAAVYHGPGFSQIEDVSASIRIVPGEGGCRFEILGEIDADRQITVFVSARCLTSRLINYLLPEAGARFVEVGLEPYARRLGHLMPETLQFLFYDQPGPQFYTWNQKSGNLGNSLLYAPSLRRKVEEATGLVFGQALLNLLYDLGPETAAVRVNFYATYSRLMNEAFFGPVKAFCERHGLRMTGHEILPHVGGYALNGGFSSVDPRVVPGVDFFGIDAFRDETAVDANNYVPQLSPKLGDSVARAHGRARTMVEIYATATRTEGRGAGQWELTPATLRAQSIRMHMAGARQVIMHALYQTSGSDGDPRLFVNPRFDFAPGLNFEPWWDHHRGIADETARLSAFLEDFRPETPVGVFYPLATALAEGPRHLHGPHFGAWCEALAKLPCGHMILDEQSIADGEVRDDMLVANGLCFSALVLPGASRIASSAVMVKLAEFVSAGGRLWISGVDPKSLRGEPLGCGVRFSDPPGLATLAELVSHLPDTAPKILAGSAVSSTVGRDSEGFWKVVIFNDGGTDEAVRVTLGAGFVFETWDVETGTPEPQRAARLLDIALAPHDLLCLRMRSGEGTGEEVQLRSTLEDHDAMITLSTCWTFRTVDEEPACPIFVTTGWQAQGYASYSGIGLYECSFDLPDACEAVLDLPGVSVAVEVRLDDSIVGRRARPPFRIDLGRLDAGPHRLALLVANTAANRFYADTPYAGEPWPDESGLTAAPRLFLLPTADMKETA